MFLVNRPSLWVLLLAFGGQTAAAQQPAFPIELSAPEKAALAELDQSRAATYPLIDSWFEGRPIQYYHFGPSAVQPSSLYRIGGGGEVVSNLPGLPGYSALLQVFDVEISPNSGIAAADVKSRDMVLGLLQTGRARLKATGLILNLPIVPDGSSLERDPESRPLKAAFYKGETVHYFDFGPTRAAAIPLLAFASGFDEGGQPEPVEGQASNASGIPGVRGYSDLWAVDAAIGGEYQPGAYRDYRRAIVDARAGRLRLTSRGVQNCPVVYVEGRPAPRPRSPLEARGNAGAVMAAAAPSDGAVRPAGAGPVVPAAATAAPAAAGIVNPAATPVGAANSYAGFAGQIAVRAPRQDAQVAVDGVLDERAWANAARLRQFSQYQPVDGRPAEDSAEVLVWYSSTTIYFGIRAYEPHGAVHATLANRDRIGGDDFVQILLDTFNDRRRALMFGVNPLGIQSDGILSEGGTGRGGGGGGLGTISTGRDTADLSADFVFQSKGRVTDWGYEVEVGIPFKTLRYQPADVQNWGINIVRKVQHSGYENTWTPARQANPSFLGQAGRLEGLTGISRGLVLDVNPELTGKAAGAAGATGWTYDTDRPEFGGNLRWGITNNLTLAGTANPDFSQVEADVQQVIADPRSAINYPEKRPFFLEGSEQFETPNQLIYTRRLVSPVGAAKLSGKLSGTGIGLLVGADERAQSASGVDNPFYEMLRLRRDIARQSTIALVSTTKIDGSNYSILAGADARFTFARLWTLQAQGVGTATRATGVSRNGPMWQASLDRSGRNYRFAYNMSGFHPDFFAAAGFQRRTNIANGSLSNRFTTFGARGATVESFAFDLSVSSTWWYQYNNRFLNGLKPNDPKLHFTGNVTLRGGWRFGAATFFEYFSYDPGLYSTYRMVRTQGAVVDTIPYVGVEKLYNIDLLFNFSTPQFKRGAATLSVITGQDENFFEWSKAWIWLITATADLRPTEKIRLSARYVRQWYIRSSDGSTVGDRQIPRLKMEYQLSRAIFLRLVTQYDIQDRDSLRDDSRTNFPIITYNARTGTYSRAGLVNTNNLRMDWLFSFQPSPGTVLFAGYGSSMTETDAFTFRDIRRTGDGFFVKLSYLLRL